MVQNKNNTPAFNDGLVEIFGVQNIAPAPKKPVEKLIKKCSLRYEERTVGINRYYTALQANVRIERVLRCPQVNKVSSQDVAIPIDGQQYQIEQVQYPKDVYPLCMDITLKKVKADYGFTE